MGLLALAAGLLGVALGVAPAAAQSSPGPQDQRLAQVMGHEHAGTAAPYSQAQGASGDQPGAVKRERAPGAGTPYRMTMEELHKPGGLPQGWRFALPAGDPEAGRAAFLDLGCQQCHRVSGGGLQGAAGVGEKPGTDLGGMGRHHPAEYFAESILNPNRVIIQGPGYTGPDGLSIMPDYVDSMTVRQLIDIVAFLKSLTGERGEASQGGTMPHK